MAVLCARRARKLWLLDTFGDGIKAPCWECAVTVTVDTRWALRAQQYSGALRGMQWAARAATDARDFERQEMTVRPIIGTERTP